MIILAYLIILAIELYFFVVQRSALEISRFAEIDPVIGKDLMLPSWFLLAWAVKIARYILLFFVFKAHGWIIPIALLIMGLILGAFIPIPHKHCFSIFRKRLSITTRGIHGVVPILMQAMSLAEAKIDGGNETLEQ
jgi:hypothetical protein